MLKVLRSASRLPMLSRTYVTCQPESTEPGTEITILPNGVRIATEETSSPLTCISLFIEAGPRFETASNNGITHLVEHMAYKGFTSMAKCDLEQSLLMLGANMSAETTREIQIFSAKCPSDAIANVVDILCKIVTELDLNDSSIELEKNNIYLEMVDKENDPKAVTFDYLHQTAFQGTPLAQGVMGPSKNVRCFNKEHVSTFISKHYQPYKLCIATCGNVRHHAMVGYVSCKLGHLLGDPACESKEGPCRFTGSQIIYRDDSMPFAHVAIGFEVPGFGHPDHLTLLAMQSMCSSWDRSQGGFEKNAQPIARAAAHLCERYETFYIPYRDVGLWGVYFVGDRMLLQDMLENIQKEWMKMCTMVDSSAVDRAVNLAKFKVTRGRDGVINSSYDIGMQMMYSCGRKSLADICDGLSSVKSHSIRNVCDKYLYDRCPAVAAVGPAENLPDYTRIRAAQYWIRL